MAWTETCKINANKQIDHLHKQGMSKRQAIKKLSDESGISYNTLNNWIYPRKSDVKNNVTPKNEVKNKKQPSQEEIWRNVGIKLKRLNAYLEKNCNGIERNKVHIKVKENDGDHLKDVSNGVKEAVQLEISKIEMLYSYGIAAEFVENKK